MSGVVKFQDPPPSKRGRPAVWPEIAATLRAHPGRWALIFESSSASARTTASQIRAGRRAGFTPSAAFEITCRVEGDLGEVYARYIGEKPP